MINNKLCVDLQTFNNLVDNGVNCPKVIKTKTGNTYSTESCSSGKHVIRLLEFIPGTILNDIPRNKLSKNLYYQLGRFVAHIDMTLKVKQIFRYNFQFTCLHQFFNFRISVIPSIKNTLPCGC